MEKLNPSKAQWKAMRHIAGIRLDAAALHRFKPIPEEFLTELIAAANSIPEGAPVGTIALHPSGKWIAHRDTPDTWEYIPFRGAVLLEHGDDADSWPVIYDPTKPELKSYPYAEGDTTVIGPECFAVPAKGVIAWQGVWYEEVKPDSPTAQQEPATTHPVSPESTNCVPKPRTPRVVNCLGVDEQGSRWRNRCGEVHEFRDGCWKYKDGRRWFPSSLSFPEYTEIVGPRVLPSLDCEDARDGTVWRGQNGWRFWFNGEWRTDNGTPGRDLELGVPRLLRGGGPYTEVFPDVAS